MADYSKIQVLEAIPASPIIPVFYNADVQISKNVLKACYEGGIRLFEFTNRGPAAVEVFKQLVPFARQFPGLILGVGSISFAKDARKFIGLGANFVVGPQFNPAVARVCKWRGMPYMPGCGTVSEVGRAQRAGCEVCKAFPGDVLGPAFVKALLAPMPWSKIMVTGGVKPTKENLEGWFKAGAFCVGMGSNLFPEEIIAAAEWEKISALCRDALSMVAAIK